MSAEVWRLSVLNILIIVVAVLLGRRFARHFVDQGYSLQSSLRLKDSLVLLGIVTGVAGGIGGFVLLRIDPGY